MRHKLAINIKPEARLFLKKLQITARLLAAKDSDVGHLAINNPVINNVTVSTVCDPCGIRLSQQQALNSQQQSTSPQELHVTKVPSPQPGTSQETVKVIQRQRLDQLMMLCSSEHQMCSYKESSKLERCHPEGEGSSKKRTRKIKHTECRLQEPCVKPHSYVQETPAREQVRVQKIPQMYRCTCNEQKFREQQEQQHVLCVCSCYMKKMAHQHLQPVPSQAPTCSVQQRQICLPKKRKVIEDSKVTLGSQPQVATMPVRSNIAAQHHQAAPLLPQQKSIPKKKIMNEDKECSLLFYRGRVIKGRYEIVCNLGEGTFGKVMECIDLSNDCMRVAVKIIKNVHANVKAFAMKEVKILGLINILDTENKFALLRMVCWFAHENHFCIVSELLGMSTYSFMKQNGNKPFTVEQIRHMGDQIFRAMNLLHLNKIAHTDLKPNNILFVNDDMKFDYKSKQFTRTHKGLDVKVVDFGSVMNTLKCNTIQVSTRPYRAPEVILGLGWNEACDVWSLGCILFEYYVGFPLFKAIDDVSHLIIMERVLGPIPTRMLQKTSKQQYVDHLRKVYNNKNLPIWPYIMSKFQPFHEYMHSKSLDHVQLFDLLRKMLMYDMRARITLKKAIEHPFFSQKHCAGDPCQ